jgi:hypothetical protein
VDKTLPNAGSMVSCRGLDQDWYRRASSGAEREGIAALEERRIVSMRLTRDQQVTCRHRQ